MSRWDGVAGHERVVAALRRAVAADKPHHSYLLLGPVGVGKMTVATLLAQALACGDGGDRPCGECIPCRKVAAGTHPDLWTEVPGGKSNTITADQVAETQRRLSYRRAEGDWRVVLIDGAGTMNETAQNKLLKTLEEPPEGTVLILCALHPSQLLVTVRSRCQKLTLAPVDPEAIARWLCDAHGADPALARSAAAASHGRPGLAVDLLDPELLQERRERTAALCLAMSGDRAAIDELVKEIGWDREAGGNTLTLLQELLRDAMVTAVGAAVTPLHPDGTPREGRMAPLSARHLADTVDRVETAREKLSRNVYAGGLVEDVLLHLATRAPGR